MGSGKTSVSKILAQKLQKNIIDLDHEIEKKEKLTIGEIFSKYGESYFRKLENSYIKEIKTFENVVISLGGGAYCNQENIDIIRASCITIYLKTSYNSLVDRYSLEEINKRPLLKNKTNVEKLLLDREVFYKQSDFIVETDNKSSIEVSNEILRLYNENI